MVSAHILALVLTVAAAVCNTPAVVGRSAPATDRSLSTQASPALEAATTPKKYAKAKSALTFEVPPRRPAEPLPPPPDRAPLPSSSAIVFPDAQRYPNRRTASPTAEDGEFLPQCGGVAFRAYDAASGQCQPLMMQAGCPAGSWWVLRRGSKTAGCQQQPCPPSQGLHNDTGRCWPLKGEPTPCAQHMQLLVNEYGEAECECEAGAVYWPAERRCYPALLRGPCRRRQQLIVDTDGTAACAPNPCGGDGRVYWPATGTCHVLRDANDTPCPPGQLDVNKKTLQLECLLNEANSVILVRSFRCARGSRRFQERRCMRMVIDAGGARVTVAVHDVSSRCTGGFTEDANGNCRRVSASALG